MQINNAKKKIMKQTFEVFHVKCGGWANTLTSKLAEEFGEVTVNLEVKSR